MKHIPHHRPCVTFDLKRSGQFHIRTTGPNHCGTKPSLDIRYTIEVSCLAGELSPRGFMFDQVGVDNYFHSIRSTSLSCERLAEHCANGLARLIAQENSGLIPIKLLVTLSPEPFLAEVTFDYVDSEAATVVAAKG